MCRGKKLSRKIPIQRYKKLARLGAGTSCCHFSDSMPEANNVAAELVADAMESGQTPANRMAGSPQTNRAGTVVPLVTVGCATNSVSGMFDESRKMMLLPVSGLCCGCPVFSMQLSSCNKPPDPKNEPILHCRSNEDTECPTCWIPSPLSLPCCLACYVPVALLSLCSDRFRAGPACFCCFFAGVPSSICCCVPAPMSDGHFVSDDYDDA